MFNLNIKAVEKLREITGQVGVFSMCGGAGVGKSYLLNCIIDFIGDRKDNGVSYRAIFLTRCHDTSSKWLGK